MFYMQTCNTMRLKEANELASIRDDFIAILQNYPQTKRNKIQRAEIAAHFEAAVSKIRNLNCFKQRKRDMAIRFGTGMGNSANVPWIALSNTRITRTIQKGVYCAYLFRADMSGVYLTLIQGVNDTEQDFEKIMAKAIDLRRRMFVLRRFGFSLDRYMTLMDRGGSGNNYEKATIAYKFYSSQNIPNDQKIEQDLEALLRAYDGYVAWNAPNPPTRTLPR